MTPVIYALPYDGTGKLPRNRALREYHDLSKQAGLTYRTFVLDNGYFYTDNIEIEDSAGTTLVPDIDFQCIGVSAEATSLSGLETASVIVILNPRITHEVFVNVSMVGGKFCDVTPAIADMSAGLLNPTRNPTWRNVTGKPDKFEVGGHLHAMWELYGFEGIVDGIDRITLAKLAISARTYRDIVTRFDGRMDVLDIELDNLLLLLQQHIAAVNPHRVTKQQVGLGNVENYPVVSSTEATTRGFNSKQRYLTVQRFKQMIDVNFSSDLTAHINRTDNPHRVTAAQAETLTIPETDAQLDTRLDKTATAVSTYAMDGYGWVDFMTYIKSNLDANQIISGSIATSQLTLTTGLTNAHALVGNNQVVDIVDKINQYAKRGTEIAYVQGAYGTDVAATLRASASNTIIWTPGSLALVMNYYGGSWGYGNASESRTAWRLQCWVKVDSVNWQPL